MIELSEVYNQEFLTKRDAVDFALSASYVGDPPDLAASILMTLNMDGWDLVQTHKEGDAETV